MTGSDTGGRTRASWRSRTGWSTLVVGGLVALFALTTSLRDRGVFEVFLASYSGALGPEAETAGIPVAIAWLHAINAVVMVLLIRSGLQVRYTRRPGGYWTPATSARGKTPTKISLEVWTHLTLTILWLVNGVVYIVVAVLSGHWVRIVPQSVDALPHALSALIQYLSLDWPAHDGWTSYNALQLLSYFMVVFIAAPLSALTGLRLSPLWPEKNKGLWGMMPMAVARAVHFPAMIFIALFTVTHVILVLITGAQENLNHMFAATNQDTLLGPILFGVSLLLMGAGWFLARPEFTGALASFSGRVTRS